MHIIAVLLCVLLAHNELHFGESFTLDWFWDIFNCVTASWGKT